MTDTQRLDWLEKEYGAALVSDDNGHWAVVWDGMQNCPMDANPCDINTLFHIKAHRWCNSVRQAIDVAMAGVGDDE